MSRDPIKDPRPGDVLMVNVYSSVFNSEVEHHLAVTERNPRSVEALIGVFTRGEGQTGGSPIKMKLTQWKIFAGMGRITVKAEECLSGWEAVQVSWERRTLQQG